MKIAFCDNSLRELLNFRGDIINHYAEKGDEVLVIAPQNIELEFDTPWMKHIPVKMDRAGMNPLNEIKYFLSLWKIYRRERPDYIFHYTIKPNIYGTLAARLLKIPSTAMIAGLGYVFGSKGVKAKVGRMLYKFALRFPEHVLVLNQYNKEVLRKKGWVSDKQMIILKGGEGVNLEKFK